MAIFTSSKGTLGAQYPAGAVDADFTRLEPLLTPELLTSRYLLGVPLVTGTPDPITKRLTRLTNDDLADYIKGAVSDLEDEIGIAIFPVQIKERQPFDVNEFRAYGFMKLRQRPCSAIQQLAMEASDGTQFFAVPLEWIETGYLHQGQLNILPLTPGLMGSSAITGGVAANIFLMALQARGHIPAFFTVTYTIGWDDGKLPRSINNLIGIETAIRTLSLLQATYQRNSQSLSIDGMSQSESLPGPQAYAVRIKDLQDQKDKKIKKLRTVLGLKLISGTV